MRSSYAEEKQKQEDEAIEIEGMLVRDMARDLRGR